MAVLMLKNNKGQTIAPGKKVTLVAKYAKGNDGIPPDWAAPGLPLYVRIVRPTGMAVVTNTARSIEVPINWLAIAGSYGQENELEPLSVNDRCKVVLNRHGHPFRLGSIVRVLLIIPAFGKEKATVYECINGKGVKGYCVAADLQKIAST